MGFLDFFRSFGADRLNAQEEAAARAALDQATRTLDIDVAIAAHENWKVRLEAYLAGNSTEDLRPEIVSCDDRCDLGKWIHGDGHTHLGRYATFSDLKATHRMFHYVASNVVTLNQAGKHDEAKQVLNGEFGALSRKIRQRLTDLKGLS